jgi:hypothetical protein
MELVGMLIIAAAITPYAIEVLSQLKLQADFMAALPEETRAKLPPHPRSRWLVGAGSLRFQLALWRYVRRDVDTDTPAILDYKRRIRASIRRELGFALGAGLVIALLVAAGWRPPW